MNFPKIALVVFVIFFAVSNAQVTRIFEDNSSRRQVAQCFHYEGDKFLLFEDEVTDNIFEVTVISSTPSFNIKINLASLPFNHGGFKLIDKQKVLIYQRGIGIVSIDTGNLLMYDKSTTSEYFYDLVIIKNTEFALTSYFFERSIRKFSIYDLSVRESGSIKWFRYVYRIKHPKFEPFILFTRSGSDEFHMFDFTTMQHVSRTEIDISSIQDCEFHHNRRTILATGGNSKNIQEYDYVEQEKMDSVVLNNAQRLFKIEWLKSTPLFVVADSWWVMLVNWDNRIFWRDGDAETKDHCFNSRNSLFAGSYWSGGNPYFAVWSIDQTGTCSDINCVECSWVNDICMKCNTGYVLEMGTCVEECSEGLYLDSEANSCFLDNCPLNKKFDFEKDLCLCPRGTVFDEVTQNCITCQEKTPKCGECKSGTLECISCIGDSELVGNECVANKTIDCQEKMPRCEICKEGKLECEKCQFPYFMNEDKSKCLHCKEIYKECEICDSKGCKKCMDELIMIKDQGCQKNSIKSIISIPYKAVFMIGALFSPSSSKFALMLSQNFRFFRMAEREYPKVTQSILHSVKGPPSIIWTKFRIFANKEKQRDDLLDKVTFEIPIKVHDDVDHSLQFCFQLMIINLLALIIYSSIKKEGRLNKLTIGESYAVTNKSILKIFNRKSHHFYSIFFSMTINFILPSFQNIFYGDDTTGIYISLFFIILYIIGIEIEIIYSSCSNSTSTIYQNPQIKNIVYLNRIFVIVDILKLSFCLFLRGDHYGQYIGLFISQMILLLFWAYGKKFFIFENKLKSVNLLIREITLVFIYFFGIWDTSFTNLCFLVGIVILFVGFVIETLGSFFLFCNFNSSKNSVQNVS